MTKVSARIELPAGVYEAERCWYDTNRWPEWVDQLARVVEVQGDWPQPGSVVVWESGPAGRGRVLERVVRYEPRFGQENEVEDASISGRQEVVFDPSGQGVEIRLALEYSLKRSPVFTRVLDALFIRQLMAASLARTLAQFAAFFDASR